MKKPADDRTLSREEYRLLVEQAPIMSWRSGLDMLCDYFNERWLDFTGRTMEQEVGNGWTEGVHPDDFDRCLEIYTSHFARREVFEMEYRLRRHDGVYRWIFDRGVPFFGDDGSFLGYIGSCVDVTARVEAEQALAAAHRAELDRLHRLLPLCAWCGKLRDDEGYWRSVAGYFRDAGLGQVSHGICPDCEEGVVTSLG